MSPISKPTFMSNYGDFAKFDRALSLLAAAKSWKGNIRLLQKSVQRCRKHCTPSNFRPIYPLYQIKWSSFKNYECVDKILLLLIHGDQDLDGWKMDLGHEIAKLAMKKRAEFDLSLLGNTADTLRTLQSCPWELFETLWSNLEPMGAHVEPLGAFGSPWEHKSPQMTLRAFLRHSRPRDNFWEVLWSPWEPSVKNCN